MNYDTLAEYIENSIKKNWELTALSDIGGTNHQFKDVAELIAKMHIMFEAAGLKPGDKIALCGKNSANWAVAFLSIITGG